ncbi:SAV_2336 N-terminal domain-related protein [Streptomyces acidiscabies]|uniref:SAV_2336 N-terminal domain-related protein n=1 Tax=Streptomyces acidiscabies TaxID=42234 RepID=A0AAP6EGI0_9ACTN|nr:SAV_2336 N-terminal domain-related protein [Streptomyces acidiscabies]MDX2961849.1 SAV_2336 N-terminal domain-related protein [Streptomyces acidiscabies]MDX3023404.1 SAV_2336 N-terminal domain-related protein [Streptomyces acidiscabies]MDX3789390.1 SAV_2336 N-terminal domain-related protein [Streptomyces acidiscabies]
MTGGGERLDEVLRILRACGYGMRELDADQILDVLWLARRLTANTDAPLSPRPASPLPQPPPPPAPAPEPDRTAVEPRQPDPDDPDLPDLIPSALYGAARQAPPVPSPGSRPESRRAMPVRVPEDKALGDELAVGRALRPLRLRSDSRHRVEIDEKRTAARFAETGLPDVVQRPVRERRLRLALLVDDGLSMLLWHRLGTELRVLLERLGAFASTRVFGLDTRGREPRLHAGAFEPDSPGLPLSAINDPSGRTLVLVVSDGMGAAWRTGTLHSLLAGRAAHGPVAVLHTLPPELWEASGIAAGHWQVTTRRIGSPGAFWGITDPVLPPELAVFEGVPVAVLEPTVASLHRWARLLASPGATAELPLLDRSDRDGAVAAPREAGSAQHFRDAATPEAYRLAAHLAAVTPLSVPVMRLVQREVPAARPSHLAEVFLGGLIRPHPAPVPGPLPAKHRVFDFSEDAKAVLLHAVPQAELLRTNRLIGRRLEELAGRSPDFPSWLAHPEGSAQLPAAHQPFTSVERRLLSRFGVSFERGSPLPGADPEQAVPEAADDWGPLTGQDPVRLGPYALRGRRPGRRTLLYRAVADGGADAVLRVPRPDRPASNARLLEVEAQALTRLQGPYAPALLGTGFEDSPPWLAMTPVVDSESPRARPVHLGEFVDEAFRRRAAPFDTLRGLLVGYHLASALAQCHASGLVLADLGADTVYVLRRTVVLGGLSDCVVDGHHLGAGPVPTAADNVRSLGGLLQLISTKAGLRVPGLPEGMHLWQGDTWEPLRRLVLRCQETDPGLRPAASEIADALARYVALHRPGAAQAHTVGRGDALARVPLALPRETPGDLPLRLPRLGPGRREAEARMGRLRVPLPYSRRLTLVGAGPHSGRATTTVMLGSVLATVRGEPVLALDGAPSEGALDGFLTDRNPATLRDLAALRTGPAYADVRALTTRLTSGLQIAAHRPGRYTPNPLHAQEYTRVLEHTAPYYSFVLADWSPRLLGWPADAVLNHTDRLILCCGSHYLSLDGALRTLDALRDSGHQRLVDEAVVVTTLLDSSVRTRLSPGFVQELGIGPARTVRVPFDNALRSTHWAPDRLRASTTRAFLDLAELVVASPRP